MNRMRNAKKVRSGTYLNMHSLLYSLNIRIYYDALSSERLIRPSPVNHLCGGLSAVYADIRDMLLLEGHTS